MTEEKYMKKSNKIVKDIALFDQLYLKVSKAVGSALQLAGIVR